MGFAPFTKGSQHEHHPHAEAAGVAGAWRHGRGFGVNDGYRPGDM
ncbi:MAG: hypothetical protein QOD10_677 [Mycobacterium sp.]|nr:hypothetical protein [Mycobacterium sp.]